MFDVSNILKHDGDLLNQEILLDIKEIQLNYDIVKFDKPLVFKGDLNNINKILTVKGTVELDFTINCYLCNEPFRYHQIIDIKETFRQSPSEDEYVILSDKIDLEKAVVDNIVIKLDTQFICKEDCKGLCQVCGKNKNIEKCDCKIENIDPRLAKLKDLL